MNILDHDVYFETFELINKNDISNCLLLFNNVIEQGFSGQHFIDGLCLHLRDLLISKNSSSQVLLEQNENLKTKYIDQAKIKDSNFILNAINLTEDCSYRYKTVKIR